MDMQNERGEKKREARNKALNRPFAAVFGQPDDGTGHTMVDRQLVNTPLIFLTDQFSNCILVALVSL